jgi:hypothetical protein
MNAALTRITNKAWWARTGKTLKYSLYTITHPFDGFWDLTHEKRGEYLNLTFGFYQNMARPITRHVGQFTVL